MASITITSGHFAVYRNADSSGASPFTEILAEDDGAACVIKDSEGNPWVFRIYNAKVQYKKATDTEGTTLSSDSWHDVVASAVEDGMPTAQLFPTSRIIVLYWKTDGKWYQSYSDNQADWTEVEITT